MGISRLCLSFTNEARKRLVEKYASLALTKKKNENPDFSVVLLSSYFSHNLMGLKWEICDFSES